eukprot:TRINITY_DN12824_c0_g1_i3.p1 TRINITY_DN12824_c0_g1~~TRINITY_DN12824_c0_g1_i3.p1  ORF type:complete len:333 (+),score=36.46 TRINITY_DN12824_c0_g1_i3:110-1108(+)
MKRKTKRKRSKKRKGGDNYVKAATPGCHVAHYSKIPNWIIGYDKFSRAEFGLSGTQSVPEISVDPESKLLTVINDTDQIKYYYITLHNPALDKNHKMLEMGTFAAADKFQQCVTLVLVLNAMHIMDTCYIKIADIQQLQLHSDVQVLKFHPAPYQFSNEHIYAFPLAGDGPYLCSQGIGGKFTHFQSGTFHAYDLQAPIGTEVLAIGAGTIVDVKDSNSASGIHVGNLFEWNSIMLRLESGAFVEYVHIQTGSSCVKVGERVAENQRLCFTGNIGFCPSPHLHIQMHASSEKNANTIKFGFKALPKPGAQSSNSAATFFPVAGQSYSQFGQL